MLLSLIPKIKVSLPVYHGTENEVLKGAIGHLEGSSLPVGGKGTHCVLSGHRGLPSAKLFTDLDELEDLDDDLDELEDLEEWELELCLDGGILNHLCCCNICSAGSVFILC